MMEFFNHTIITHIDFLKQDRIFYLTVNDTSAGYKAVLNLASRIVFCRRKIIYLGVDLRVFLEEIVAYIRF